MLKNIRAVCLYLRYDRQVSEEGVWFCLTGSSQGK